MIGMLLGMGQSRYGLGLIPCTSQGGREDQVKGGSVFKPRDLPGLGWAFFLWPRLFSMVVIPRQFGICFAHCSQYNGHSPGWSKPKSPGKDTSGEPPFQVPGKGPITGDKRCWREASPGPNCPQDKER